MSALHATPRRSRAGAGLVSATTAVLGLLAILAPAVRSQPAPPRQSVVAVALENAGQVAILRAHPWRVARRVVVPAGPHNVAASPTGTYFAVTSPPAGTVTLIGAGSGAIAQIVSVPGGPHDAAFAGDGRTLWITAPRARLLVQVAVPSGRVLRRLRTSGAPHDLEVDTRRNQLWITIDGSSRVEVRQSATGRLIARPSLRTTWSSRRTTARSCSATGPRRHSRSSP